MWRWILSGIQKALCPPLKGTKVFLLRSPPREVELHETNPRFGLLEIIGRFKKSAFTGNIVRKKKVHKTFAYPVKTVKSSKYIPARANNSFDSESTETSRTFWDRRCPRMSLVHLAITALVTLAGLSVLQPHVPPAICPYSQEAMSRKYLLYHAYTSISELVKLCDVDVT